MNPISKTLRVLKKLHINNLYRKVENKLPRWVNSRIASISDKYIVNKRLVIVEELKPKQKQALSYLRKQLGSEHLGDYLEFGVCQGTSMMCMDQTLKKLKLNNVRLIGFDSFEGLPATASVEDDGKWKPGEFAAPLEMTTKFLTEGGIDWNKTFLIKGWFSDTLTDETRKKYTISKVSVIMMDCDIYSSSKASLEFCAPLIKDKTIIIFDDWNGRDLGEGKAFDEFLKENPHFTAEKFGTYKPSGKIYLITNKLTSV